MTEATNTQDCALEPRWHLFPRFAFANVAAEDAARLAGRQSVEVRSHSPKVASERRTTAGTRNTFGVQPQLKRSVACRKHVWRAATRKRSTVCLRDTFAVPPQMKCACNLQTVLRRRSGYKPKVTLQGRSGNPSKTCGHRARDVPDACSRRTVPITPPRRARRRARHRRAARIGPSGPRAPAPPSRPRPARSTPPAAPPPGRRATARRPTTSNP